jgi:hypothetical protein
VNRFWAPTESVLHVGLPAAHSASTRPLIVTGASSWISPSQPSDGRETLASSVVTTLSRELGADSVAAKVPSGGAP